jgi:tetratricopeptide (TPR) repeat protein
MSVAIIVKDIQQDQKVMQFNSVRLFRRGSVRYEGVVHNTPVILNGKADAILFPYVYIKHYGYDLTPEMQAKKRARTEGLLLKRIQQNPDDVVAYFYLTQAYTAYNEIGKAAECIEKYKEVSTRTGVKFNGSIYTTAFHVYKMLGDKQNAYEWLVAGLKDCPKDLDLLMSLTEFGVWTTNIEFISKGARGFLRVYDEYQRNPIAGGNRFTYANTPESYAYCLFHLSMITFQEACVLLEQLKNVLNVTREPFKMGVREDVQSIFQRFGLTKDDWASEKKIVTL